MAQLKIPLSFKETEKDMYDYVKKQLNYSAYLKGLIIKDMDNSKPKKENSSFNFDF